MNEMNPQGEELYAQTIHEAEKILQGASIRVTWKLMHARIIENTLSQ